LQGLYSYYDKVQGQKPNLIIKSEKVICLIKQIDKPKIYVVNGKEIKNCIENTKKDALVYIWGPKCKSKICYPLNIIQSECDENNIELYIVAEYYDSELMDIHYNIKNPIYGIDIDYYKKKLSSKYLSKFTRCAL